jgi:hypothetical protein
MNTTLMSLALGGLSFFWFRSNPFYPLVHAQVVKPAVALQATFSENMYAPDGSLSVQKVKHYARFKDHSIFTETDEILPQKAVKLVEILDVHRDVWIDLDVDTHSSTTFKNKQPEAIRHFIEGLATESCGDIDLSKASPSDDLFGHKTYYVKDQPDSAWTRERWVAPDLNCLSLKRIDSLSGGSKDEELVTALSVSEPPESLRTVPFGFTERDPDSVEALHKASKNGEVFWGPILLRRRRKDYGENR